jgi:hypothetical protein
MSAIFLAVSQFIIRRRLLLSLKLILVFTLTEKWAERFAA